MNFCNRAKPGMDRKYLTILLACLTFLGAGVRAEEKMSLHLEKTIPLPEVRGRIDHLAVDPAGERLFVAALGDKTLEVIDLKGGQCIHTIKDLKKSQEVVYLPEFRRLLVTNGGDGICGVYDGDPCRETAMAGPVCGPSRVL